MPDHLIICTKPEAQALRRAIAFGNVTSQVRLARRLTGGDSFRIVGDRRVPAGYMYVLSDDQPENLDWVGKMQPTAR